MWSRPTLVSDRHAAVPGVGRVEPAAEAHLDQRDVEPGLGEVAEHRPRSAARTRSAGRGGARRGPRAAAPRRRAGRSRPAAIGAPSTTMRSRYVTRCGLGVSPTRSPAARERGPGQREHAPLAVGPGDQRAAHVALRVAERAQQRPVAPEAEPDPEPAAASTAPRARPRRSAGPRRRRARPRSLARSARPRRRRTG